MDGSFEAKVTNKRESVNGAFLTLQVNPADYAAVADLRAGASLMVAFSEVVNTAVEPIVVKNDTPAKTHFAWADLAPTVQAGIRCSNPEFIIWLGADTIEAAAAKVREFCHVDSRSDIKPGTEAAKLWAHMDRDFQAYQVSARYKDSVR